MEENSSSFDFGSSMPFYTDRGIARGRAGTIYASSASSSKKAAFEKWELSY